MAGSKHRVIARRHASTGSIVPASIRRASDDDADFIAWTVLAAQRGHRPRGWFDIALDRPEPECLAFLRRLAVTPTRSWWHTSQFWIADVDGMPAAALCAMPAGDTRATARAAIEEAVTAAGLDVTEQAAIWRRGAYARPCWIQGDDSGWLVEHVAARPSHRGQGLVQALLDHALTAGKVRGFERASIPFYIGNEAAERCYARAGFTFAEEKRDAAFEALTGAPGFRRFARAI
jgi:ribosomal protein S18 acetylase RimI-like enzyme